MDNTPGGEQPLLTWSNVALALSFVAFDAVLSSAYRLGISSSLISAALRCIIQLSVMALVLEKIFKTQDPLGVAGLALLLNLLGTVEIVVNKCKRRHKYIFFSSFIAMLCATAPVSIIGTRFAMSIIPFWTPEQFIPIVGMLSGNSISAIVVSIDYVLKEFVENRDKIEVHLAFGGSRLEACRPVAKQALRLALTPMISQMSVIGMISIPGTMTGSILGGAPVAQAARLQMVLMFLISSVVVLSSIVATGSALMIVIDQDHRIRMDRIDSSKFILWKYKERLFEKLGEFGSSVLDRVRDPLHKRGQIRLGEQ
ncbi:UPF0014-domain-containing protein [Thelephora ganbajun]|uniref:UPF0014-domain-containing protein n=1 Tax=Thelephora ganbajun TaxID=370292 RepID=A0ACB6ZGL3_THEGA|nr:UPF0014-domain-containing protein [Thelephora ganbajun]